MVDNFFLFENAGGEPILFDPPPVTVLEGNPTWRVWRHLDGPLVRTGIFEASPGKWAFEMDVWEYVTMRSGRCALHHPDGTVAHFGPGDSFVVAPGYAGVMEIIETVTQQFFMRLA